MGKKAYQVLLMMVAQYPELISSVVVARDSGVDNDYHDEIYKLCKTNGIPIIGRSDNKESLGEIFEYSIAIGWRWMLPDKARLIVIHDSLLPKYRGFNPLVSSLINGDRQIGATALFASKSYDSGPILSQRSVKIDYPIKISTAIDIVSFLYCEILDDIVSRLKKGEALCGLEQNESEATYSLWRDKHDYYIRWSRSSAVIARFVDAVGSPYEGAKCFVDGQLAYVHECTVCEDINIVDREHAIGKVMVLDDGCPVIVCGEGVLKITSITDVDGKNLLPLKKLRIRFS